MKPRILFVSQYFYPEAVSNNKVVKNLIRLGYDVDVITAVPNYPDGKFFDGFGIFKRRTEVHDGAHVQRMPVIPRGSNTKLRLIVNAVSFVITAGWKAFWLKPKQYDLVFCSLLSPGTMSIPAAIASTRMRVPSVCWVQDLWPETPIQLMGIKNPLIVSALQKVFGWVYRSNSAILIQSEAYVPELEKVVPGKDLLFFPNTIDTFQKPMEDGGSGRKEIGFKPSDTVLMYAGNMGTGQNLDGIVDAAIQLDDPSVKFVFLGDGRDRERIIKRVADCGLSDQFRFLGRVAADAVPKHMAYADAAILTLRAEPALAPTIPFRMQGFLGCGKIVLGSIAGEPARIISEHDCGFVSPPDSETGLADSIRALMKLSRAQRRAMEKRSLDFAQENYDEQKVYDRLNRFLRNLIGKSASS